MLVKLLSLSIFSSVFIEILGHNGSEFVSPVLNNNKKTPNWFSFAGKTYYVDTVFKANFYKSLQFCRQQGMHLLSINSQIENDRIGKFINDNGLSYGHYWTSASNLVGDNEWVWLSTGQNMRYANWYPGEPSGKNSQNNSENCVEARHWAQPSGFTWNDIDCSVEMYFICESIIDCPSNIPDRRLSYGHYWTSATNLGGDNEWIWLSTGQNMRYANWYPGEPSGKNSQNNSENCVEARHWAQPSGFTWNDIGCLTQRYFICESIVDCPSNVPNRRKK